MNKKPMLVTRLCETFLQKILSHVVAKLYTMVRFCGLVMAVVITTGINTVMAQQQCDDYIPNQTPDARYSVGANQDTVLDTQTGLTWLRCSVGQASVGNSCTGTASALTWQGALQSAEQANSINLAGHNDWRVPNVKELTSLLALNCRNPSINTTVFPNTGSGGSYWSSSPFAGNSDNAWNVNFGTGADNNFIFRRDPQRVRLVR